MPVVEVLMKIIHGQIIISLPLTIEKPALSGEYPVYAAFQMKNVPVPMNIPVCLLLQCPVKMMSLP